MTNSLQGAAHKQGEALRLKNKTKKTKTTDRSETTTFLLQLVQTGRIFKVAEMPVHISMLQSLILLREKLSAEHRFSTGMDACSNLNVAKSDTTGKALCGTYMHFEQAWMPVQILKLQNLMLLLERLAKEARF